MNTNDVMTKNVVTVSPDHGVRHAATIMLVNHVSGLPVIDDEGRLVGLISEGDLLRRVELGLGAIASSAEPAHSVEERARAYVRSNAWKVADVMSCDLVVVDEETPLARVAFLMAQHRIKRIPVMRGSALVGIVSRADLLHAISGAKPDETAAGDKAIRRSIITRLNEQTGLEGKAVTVTVADGLVHLWGNVDTDDCRNAARVVAESVRGVRGVVQHFPQEEPDSHRDGG